MISIFFNLPRLALWPRMWSIHAHMDTLSLTKEARIYNGLKTISLTSGAGKTGQSVHPKGYQSWVFIGRIDAEAETPILWSHDVKNWLIGKDPDAGKDWGQEENGTTEDEMVGWHHRLDGLGFGWTPGVGDGHGGLACCCSWGCKELDTTEWLNWTELSNKSS